MHSSAACCLHHCKSSVLSVPATAAVVVLGLSCCAGHAFHRISPDSNLSDDISTESDRVRFLQAVAAITLSKTRTRLNLKKLYAADGAAVRELLKLAQLLHKATHTVSSYEEVRAASAAWCTSEGHAARGSNTTVRGTAYAQAATAAAVVT